MNEKNILVTGFEPFGGETVNPAWEAVKDLQDYIGSMPVCKVLLPTEFGRAEEALDEAIEKFDPVIAVCVGQAGGSDRIRLERLAVNLRDASGPDNAGRKPKDEPVVPGGPDGLFSTLPLRAVHEALRHSGIPAVLSLSAGTFVCNSVMYHLMYRLRRDGDKAIGGFVHVPFLPAQAAFHAGAPCMSPDLITKALGIILEAAADSIKARP